MNRPSLDERKNVRPYVLGACFVWGLLFGFLFYVLRDHTTIIEDPKPVKQTSSSENSGSNTENQNTATTLTTTDPVNVVTPPVQDADLGSLAPISEAERNFGAGIRPPKPTEAKKIENDQPATNTVKRLTTRAPEPATLKLDPSWGLNGQTVHPPQRPVAETPKPGSPSSASPGTKGPTPDTSAPKPAKPIKLDDLPELDL